jgi:hypothetical protein
MKFHKIYSMRVGGELEIGPISGASLCYNRRSGILSVTANADAPCPVTRGRSSCSKRCVQAHEKRDALPLAAMHRSARRLQSSA